MAFDGNGTFLRIMNWVQDAASGIKIKSDRHDQNDDDFAAGLTNCITKDGQTQPTANLPMNGKKLVNLGDPTADTDAVNKKYVDNVKTFTKGLEISGADDFGRLKFLSLTGINGLAFTGADLGWFAKLADGGAGTKNRMVLNTKPDGSGTDVITLNDDGSFVADKTYGKTEIGVKPSSGNGRLAFYAADGTTVRAAMDVPSGAVADATFTINGKVFTFADEGNFKVGAASLGTDGNLNGTKWSAWGNASAFDAISARIEERATAVANSKISALQYRKTSLGLNENSGGFTNIVGAVIVGYHRGSGDRAEVYGLYYMYLQVFDPVRGWVGFTG